MIIPTPEAIAKLGPPPEGFDSWQDYADFMFVDQMEGDDE